ncbi:MAG: hypothetical protein M1376_15285 [Planctomycetes bacterium]|nr:hypothetical protein [Planctomycetota bacterium]
MSFFKRLFASKRRTSEPKFEDYRIQTGYTNAGGFEESSIEEFFALGATGATHNEAIWNLRPEFEKRIAYLKERGEPIPLPGSGKGRARFAANDQIEVLRPLIDEFWSEILGTSYSTSCVSNESRLSTWDHYLSGGRAELIQKVKERYGVNISSCYDEPIPAVLRRIRDASR